MRIGLLVLLLAACGHAPSGTQPDAGGSDASTIDAPADAAPFGDPFMALAALPGMCSADGWCWRWPTPHGNDYVRVFSTAPDNIWLTARQGTVMQWNGYAWITHRPPVLPGQQLAQFPMSIGGSSSKNMWLIYGTTLQQWDGSTWTIRDSLSASGNPNFNNVWVAPDGHAWVTQSDGTLKRWHNGTSQALTPCGGCFLGSIWGLASNDFFITTLPAGILHYNGQTFELAYQGPNILGGYTGTTNDIWASGGSGHVMHWNGTTWTPIPTPPETNDRWIEPVGYVAKDDVWWWVLDRPGFLHWDGTELKYTPVDAYQDEGLPGLKGTIVDGRWWLVGDSGAVYTRTGPETIGAIVRPQMRGLQSMWGSAEDNMYFAFGGHIRHWDGVTMTTIPIRANKISGVRTNGVDELFATGFEKTPANEWITTALHFDGISWSKTEVETKPLAERRLFAQVHVLGPGEAIAVGFRGVAYLYTNGAWNPITTNVTTDLYGVWGPGPDYAWIAGKNGTLLVWDRGTPSVAKPDTSLSTTADLGPIHGANGIAWLAQPVGSRVWRNAGAGWTQLDAITVGNSEGGGIFAVSETNVVMSSAAQTLVARWNGTSFVKEDNASAMPMPVMFQPPGDGKMLAGWATGGIVEHP